MNTTLKTPARTLLRWTRFKSDSNGTGPEKRTAQISDLLASAGIGVSIMQPPTSLPQWQTWLAGIQSRVKFGACASVDRAGVGLLGYRTLFYREALKAHRGAPVLLWETTYDTLLPMQARAAGWRIVAVPHNLEALVSEQVFSNADYDPSADLAAEVRRLALADFVFTIAKEERWFLESRGLTPDYLPYFPDAALAQACASIRACRMAQADPHGAVTGPLLLLGAAFNPATARGMAAQLGWLASMNEAAPPVIVAGPQSDILLSSFRSPRVEILGRVTRAHLVTLLQSCCALLIHTTGGAGAVTRIPEALLSGVPVIANPNAARDQAGVTGVAVYATPEEFRNLVSLPHSMPPAPSAPTAASARFQKALLNLLGPT